MWLCGVCVRGPDEYFKCKCFSYAAVQRVLESSNMQSAGPAGTGLRAVSSSEHFGCGVVWCGGAG